MDTKKKWFLLKCVILFCMVMTTISFSMNNRSVELGKYIKDLTGEDINISKTAADSLVAFGNDAVPLLIETLSIVKEEKVNIVTDVLIRIGEPAKIAASKALTGNDTLLINRIKAFLFIGKWEGGPIDNNDCKLVLQIDLSDSSGYKAILRVSNPLFKEEVRYEDKNLMKLNFSGKMESDTLTLQSDLWGLDGKRLPAFMKLIIKGNDMLEGIGAGNPVAMNLEIEGSNITSWGIQSVKADLRSPWDANRGAKYIWFEYPFFTCSCFKSEGTSWNPKKQNVKLIFKKETNSHNKPSLDPEYGLTPKNPILTGGGPEGEIKYLQNLLCEDGLPIMFERTGSHFGFGVTEYKDVYSEDGKHKLVDSYEIVCSDGKHKTTLYLYMYEKGEVYAPRGFRFRGSISSSSQTK